jgi:hypothetical protein
MVSLSSLGLRQLFASGASAGASGVRGGAGRLGKAIAREAALSILVRSDVQGPWLSGHGLGVVLGLVKSWSCTDSHAATEDPAEADTYLTQREFTRALLLCAHVTHCGSQRIDAVAAAAAAAAGPAGEPSVATAFWALLSQMELSPYCAKLGLRFSNTLAASATAASPDKRRGAGAARVR